MDWSEDRPRKRETFEIGADLSALSIEELARYIEILDGERKRVEAALEAKKRSMSAADDFFKS